jgi:hypothetical protein
MRCELQYCPDPCHELCVIEDTNVQIHGGFECSRAYECELHAQEAGVP